MVKSGCIDSEPAGTGAAAMSASAGAFENAAGRVGAARPSDFAVGVERRGRGTAVLVLAGELDLYRAPDVESALAEAADPSPDGGEIPAEAVRHLVVDLRWVTFIDSTALALLLAASWRQQAQGGELLLLVGPQTPTTAFEVTGFDRLLAIRRLDDHPAESAL